MTDAAVDDVVTTRRTPRRSRAGREVDVSRTPTAGTAPFSNDAAIKRPTTGELAPRPRRAGQVGDADQTTFAGTAPPTGGPKKARASRRAASAAAPDQQRCDPRMKAVGGVPFVDQTTDAAHASRVDDAPDLNTRDGQLSPVGRNQSAGDQTRSASRVSAVAGTPDRTPIATRRRGVRGSSSGDQSPPVNQEECVAVAPDRSVTDLRGTHVGRENSSGPKKRSASGHEAPAGGEGQTGTGDRKVDALADLIAEIVDRHRVRRALLGAEGDMARRIKSKERSAASYRQRQLGIETAPSKLPVPTKADVEVVQRLYPSFHACLEILEQQRKQEEKPLIKAVRQLPIWQWAAEVRGLGELSVAAIVGEAGDIGSYKTVPKLWKRMGLAVIDGERQRLVPGEAAKIHGYNPARRSVMHVIGSNLIRACNVEYRALYDQRKAYEMGSVEEAEAPRVETLGHAHNRALRFMEKRLLREIWRAWRRTKVATPPNGDVSGAETTGAAP